jgi:hypothetical protein
MYSRSAAAHPQSKRLDARALDPTGAALLRCARCRRSDGWRNLRHAGSCAAVAPEVINHRVMLAPESHAEKSVPGCARDRDHSGRRRRAALIAVTDAQCSRFSCSPGSPPAGVLALWTRFAGAGVLSRMLLVSIALTFVADGALASRRRLRGHVSESGQLPLGREVTLPDRNRDDAPTPANDCSCAGSLATASRRETS